jgi:hypothetical protein
MLVGTGEVAVAGEDVAAGAGAEAERLQLALRVLDLAQAVEVARRRHEADEAAGPEAGRPEEREARRGARHGHARERLEARPRPGG